MPIPDDLLLAALRVAEKAALDHVRWLRRQGVPLDEAASAIGLDPANARNWDDVTMAYAQAQAFLDLTPADSARHRWPVSVVAPVPAAGPAQPTPHRAPPGRRSRPPSALQPADCSAPAGGPAPATRATAPTARPCRYHRATVRSRQQDGRSAFPWRHIVEAVAGMPLDAAPLRL
jgi:hypothetical protein